MTYFYIFNSANFPVSGTRTRDVFTRVPSQNRTIYIPPNQFNREFDDYYKSNTLTSNLLEDTTIPIWVKSFPLNISQDCEELTVDITNYNVTDNNSLPFIIKTWEPTKARFYRIPSIKNAPCEFVVQSLYISADKKQLLWKIFILHKKFDFSVPISIDTLHDSISRKKNTYLKDKLFESKIERHIYYNKEQYILVYLLNELTKTYSLYSINQPSSWNSSENHYILNEKPKKPIVDIGTLDLETFTNITRNEDSSNSLVYAIGFALRNTYNKDSVYNLNTKERFKLKTLDNKIEYLESTDLDITTYYLSDYLKEGLTHFEAEHNMVVTCIKDLCYKAASKAKECIIMENPTWEHRKSVTYPSTVIYVHNLVKFDSVFIYRHLKLYNSQVSKDWQFGFHRSTQHNLVDKELISLVLTYRGNKITIRDSYKMTNSSLSKLSKAFDLPEDYSKSIFPYHFPTVDLLNYEGKVPSKLMFPNNKLTDKEYMRYSESFNIWNLRTETLKYLRKDLISLWFIMDILRYTTYNKFKFDITLINTTAGLAFNILHKKYKGFKTIPQIKKPHQDNYLRQSLAGGFTTLFRPTGENLYYYDVNSFYPSVAKFDELPTLNYTIIKYNNAVKYNNKIHIGIWTALVESPANDYVGCLHVRTNQGTVFPTGKFMGIWTHVELDWAWKNGYNIKIVEGYKLNIAVSPFKNYVTRIYNERKKTTNEVENILYKLLLNSLIGRFALNTNKPTSKLLPISSDYKSDLINLLFELPYFTSDLDLDSRPLHLDEHQSNISDPNDFVLLTHNSNVNKTQLNIAYQSVDKISSLETSMSDLNLGSQLSTNITLKSVIITSYINAYARVKLMQMIKLIRDSGSSVYYCDTDSLVVDKPLPNKYVSDKDLGKFKLEGIYTKGYFLGIKLYALLDEEGKLRTAHKGITESPTIELFENLYNNNEDIAVLTTRTHGSLTQGYKTINTSQIKINPNQYKHRIKIYKDNKWVDTRPLNVNED